MSLPAFTRRGHLPPGVHWATWLEFAERFGQTPRRRVLLAGIRAVAFELRRAGCRRVWIDGSFVTTKRSPEDFDGCWDYQDVALGLLRKTTLLDFSNGCRAQKAKYGGEMFLSHFRANAAGTVFLEFFQSDLDGRRKGIVGLNLERLEQNDQERAPVPSHKGPRRKVPAGTRRT